MSTVPALQPAGPVPPAIPFPDLAAQEARRRARERAEQARLNEITRRQAAAFQAEMRHDQALRAARSEGLAQGYQQGYVDGCHWGIWVGAALGMLAGSGAVVTALKFGLAAV